MEENKDDVKRIDDLEEISPDLEEICETFVSFDAKDGTDEAHPFTFYFDKKDSGTDESHSEGDEKADESSDGTLGIAEDVEPSTDDSSYTFDTLPSGDEPSDASEVDIVPNDESVDVVEVDVADESVEETVDVAEETTVVEDTSADAIPSVEEKSPSEFVETICDEDPPMVDETPTVEEHETIDVSDEPIDVDTEVRVDETPIDVETEQAEDDLFLSLDGLGDTQSDEDNAEQGEDGVEQLDEEQEDDYLLDESDFSQKKDEDMDENTVKNIEKTVVDTVIINNVVSNPAAPSAAPVVNVNVQDGANKKYDVADLTVPDSDKSGTVVYATNEVVVKSYQIIKGAGAGTATVTNRRLIIESEFRVDIPIENVGCVTSARKSCFKPVKFIFALLFIAICAFSEIFNFTELLSNMSWLIWVIRIVGGILGLIGLIMLVKCFEKRFVLNVYSQGVTPFVMFAKRKKDSDNLATSLVISKKGRDFDRFVGEIGALIIQLKDALEGRL